MERCEHCKGAGLVKKDRLDLKLKNCDCKQKDTCYLCENTNRLGPYKECEECLGNGELSIAIITETHNKITIVNKNG